VVYSWGKFGDGVGDLKDPCGIVIYRDIVYIINKGNCRIQAFICYGKPVFERPYDYGENFDNICGS